jgi:signal transduction histidine kinase/CheY-like chemotaxis protein
MNKPTSTRLCSWIKLYSAIASATAVAVGCIVLAGWEFNVETLKRILPHAVSMNPLTAVGVALAGASLAAWQAQEDCRPTARPRRIIAQAIGGLVALLALLKLGDLLLGWNLAADRVLFRDKLDLDPVYVNRMAPTTAFGLALLGAALISVDWELRPKTPGSLLRWRPAQFLSLVVAAIALLAIVGHLYGVRPLTGLQLYIPMAVHTAVAFLIVATGILALRPDRGIMARVVADHAGGVLIRRILTAMIGIPVLLGWLILIGQQSGMYDAAFAYAIFVVLIVVVFMVTVWVSAVMLDRKEAERDRAEEAVRLRAAELASANEALAQAKEAADAASLAKSTFLANMSHEIRTPLNGVIGMTELVLKSKLSGQQHEYLMTVKDSGEALLSVINDILDFSKIEAGKLVLDNAPFNLHESLGDTMKSFALRAHQRGLELVCFIHPEVPCMLDGDYTRLRQIVVNLVGNALKFTEKGEIGLDVSMEPCDAAGSSEFPVNNVGLHFVVSDTGIGIPEEKRAKVFEMFEQADNTTTRRHGGTGLGLAIVQRLVGLMDGRIWVESQVGRGSDFHFTARFKLAEAGAEERDAKPPESLEAMRALVVDDNATNRRILEETLRSWKIVPTTVASAGEALVLMRRAATEGTPYHLVLSDGHMPETDGFEFAEQVKQDPAIASSIIMMLTSGDRPDDIAECQRLGIAAYLLKPIKQSELLKAIERATGTMAPKVELAQRELPESRHVSGLNILLAEDSLVNQKLAVALLEAQGYKVTVVGTGKEAVAAARVRKYDLILMDVQMPEMDGLEATDLIRAKERESGRHVPIIAMTAHAMQQDRARCLEAGMDGYVSKPIRSEELFRTIDATFTGKLSATPACSTAGDVINWSDALKTMHGDQKLLTTLADAALEEIPRLMTSIREAIATADRDKLRLAGHTLKGSVRYFGASRLFECAARLEVMGCNGNLGGSEVALADLEPEVEQFMAALAECVRTA